jgi:cytochrome c oxidase subunit 3
MTIESASLVRPRPAGPARRERSRLAINRIGLWLFILSETFLFGALISSRYFLHRLDIPAEVNQPLGLVLTSVLLLSSLSAYRAEVSAAHGNQSSFEWNLLATIGLGVLFLVGVGVEWNEAFEHFPPHTGYGTIFFTTTGIHAFHVLSGLIALTIVYALGRTGRFTSGSGYWGVEGTVKYWHFVDVAWVFIYPTLYLVS